MITYSISVDLLKKIYAHIKDDSKKRLKDIESLDNFLKVFSTCELLMIYDSCIIRCELIDSCLFIHPIIFNHEYHYCKKQIIIDFKSLLNDFDKIMCIIPKNKKSLSRLCKTFGFQIIDKCDIIQYNCLDFDVYSFT